MVRTEVGEDRVLLGQFPVFQEVKHRCGKGWVEGVAL